MKDKNICKPIELPLFNYLTFYKGFVLVVTVYLSIPIIISYHFCNLRNVKKCFPSNTSILNFLKQYLEFKQSGYY